MGSVKATCPVHEVRAMTRCVATAGLLLLMLGQPLEVEASQARTDVQLDYRFVQKPCCCQTPSAHVVFMTKPPGRGPW